MLEQHPAFFNDAPTIKTHDPLAQFLGATSNGVIEYHYADAVSFAGHSCPTVAAAYLSTRAGLQALYPEEPAERGAVRVEFEDDREAGVTGVMAGVATLLTGATDNGGFKGIGGHFARRDLLAFNAPMDGDIRFTRTDNGQKADVAINLSPVPMAPEVQQLMPLCISDQASKDEQAEFQKHWQARVKALLLEHADDPNVISVKSQ